MKENTEMYPVRGKGNRMENSQKVKKHGARTGTLSRGWGAPARHAPRSTVHGHADAALSRCSVLIACRAVLREGGEALQLTVELVELRAARGQPRLALALRCVRGLHEGLEGAHDLGRALLGLGLGLGSGSGLGLGLGLG